MASKCDHTTPQWHLADCNEDGWKCAECGHAFGFRPDFDREHTLEKVETILFWLHEHDIIYISNATEGDAMACAVARQCAKQDVYDQQSIVHMIASVGLADHQAFWRKEAEQAMCSHPSRSLAGNVSRCNACSHEVKQGGELPLFASKEPF